MTLFSLRLRLKSLGLTTICLNIKNLKMLLFHPKNIPAYLSFLQDCGRSYGLTILGYGHLGDGNIHVNILNESLSEQDWLNASKEVIPIIMKLFVVEGQ